MRVWRSVALTGLAAGTLLAPSGSPPASAAEKPGPGAEVVAMVGGAPIRASELDAPLRGRLFELKNQEYALRRRVLDELVAKALLEREAAARKLSVQELVRTEIEAKVPAISEEDKKAAYESQKARFQGRSEAEALTAIEAGLRGERLRDRRAELLRELRGKSEVLILLEPPRAEVEPGDNPSRGAKEAQVTIVEFSDFQCPYCGQVAPTVKRVVEQYGDRVRLVFRDFPLPNHPLAPKAAEAGWCANEQGKFWEMHDRLFAQQQALQVPDLKRHAADLGLDAPRFEECLDSGRFAARWQANRNEGARVGVSGTPAFFVNGRMLVGAQSYQAFADVIEDELARAKATAPADGPKPAPVPAKKD